LAIVDALARQDRSPAELRRALGVESNLLAHHLGVLERVGLVARSPSQGDRRRRYVRLTDVGASMLSGSTPITAVNVVFVCTRNSARSQLAAALWNSVHEVPATSAGTRPADRVHPYAVAAASTVGLDLADSIPQSLENLGIQPDLVVTVCDRAHEELRGVGRRSLHWSLPDPARDGRRPAFDSTVRRLRGRIDRVAPLVRSAAPTNTGPVSKD
jgi:protein-tyrosine-phosphatase